MKAWKGVPGPPTPLATATTDPEVGFRVRLGTATGAIDARAGGSDRSVPLPLPLPLPLPPGTGTERGEGERKKERGRALY